jgi:hypothetical protein
LSRYDQVIDSSREGSNFLTVQKVFSHMQRTAG